MSDVPKATIDEALIADNTVPMKFPPRLQRR